MLYAVWYASAGCLPDSEYPEFVGTEKECEAFIAENAHDYERPEVEHDLYSLTINEHNPWDLELVDCDHDWAFIDAEVMKCSHCESLQR